MTCACPTYPFPHKEGGGKCEMPDFCGQLWGSNYEDCFFLYLDKPCPHHDWGYLSDAELTPEYREVPNE